MVASKLAGILFLVAVLVIGMFIGFGFSLFVDLSKVSIDPEVNFYASKVTVEVVDTGRTFTFNLDDPLTKVLYYQGGGVVLGVRRVEVEWQVVLGQEDWPYDGKGDSCDVILKIWKTKGGTVTFQVACLGGFSKKVYYGSQLKLDTSTGQRCAEWSIP